MRRVVGSRTVLVATGVIVLGVAGLFFALGLDNADKLGSVVAALAAIAGLGLTVAGARRRDGTGGGSGGGSGEEGAAALHGSTVGGSATVVGRVGGSVRLTGTRTPRDRAPRDLPEPEPGGDAAAGGASIGRSAVDGDAFVAGTVDGDVETRPE